jgi:3'-phosphoadenosine 5'-phosphosulfate sulfotransferase (PAPS reductase)/FAD synthetase
MYISKTDGLPAEVNLRSYDRIVVAFSGGKDSLACLLHLLECGVEPERIELHHHDVDGGGRTFMDWPITEGYCKAIADYFDIPLYLSYKEGGFEREMLRNGTPTAPMRWQRPDGSWGTCGGVGPDGTRRKFPQTSADLKVRWCSAYLKIDVLAAIIRNDERFQHSRTLVVTGERAEESSARAKYKTFEPNRSDARDGRKGRHVDHWRPIHAWDEANVWAIIGHHGIVAHPGYFLGYGRLSCRRCIFSSANQWATDRALYPETHGTVGAYEAEFGVTIRRSETVKQLADKGVPYTAALSQPDLAAFANQKIWDRPAVTNDWRIPAGAFGENAGPS